MVFKEELLCLVHEQVGGQFMSGQGPAFREACAPSPFLVTYSKNIPTPQARVAGRPKSCSPIPAPQPAGQLEQETSMIVDAACALGHQPPFDSRPEQADEVH